MLSLKQSNSISFELQTTSASPISKLRSKQDRKIKHHKKKKFGVKKLEEKQLFNSSLWTLAENQAYINFLTLNTELFCMSKLQRRDAKINVMMSRAIGTRSPDQCRSHHQKMIKYHEDIPTIISHVLNLQQNQEQNQNATDSRLQNKAVPTLKNFMDQEDVFENISFCDQLMNQEWNVI